MKLPRSFSLLTFLLLATVAAVGAALYQANSELHEKRILFKQYSEEMGFLEVEEENESKLHIRKLGGYPQMSFAFRYQLPEKQFYTLRVGSGVVDPETGFPPSIFNSPFSNDESQGTLVVSFNKMPTEKGILWTVRVIDEGSLSTKICDDEYEFTWLQTYLDAFPTDGQVGNPFSYARSANLKVEGHGSVQMFEPDEVPILYRKDEYHPSAVASLTDELRKNRRTVVIWLEPVTTNQKTAATSEGSARGSLQISN